LKETLEERYDIQGNHDLKRHKAEMEIKRERIAVEGELQVKELQQKRELRVEK